MTNRGDEGSITVPPIDILVATISPDVKAEGIAQWVLDKRPDMRLVGGSFLPATTDEDIQKIDGILDSLPLSERCALVLVGRPLDTSEQARWFLSKRSDLVVLQVDVVGDSVQIGYRNPQLGALLDTLRDLVDQKDASLGERIARFRLEGDAPAAVANAERKGALVERPLLLASVLWIHAVLRDAVSRMSEENGDANGFSLTRQTILESLDALPWRLPPEHEAEVALWRAYAEAEWTAEPLVAAARTFELRRLDFKLMLLAMAPEFDIRFQRCIGFLQDDLSRRVGGIGLLCGLLGDAPQVRARFARSGPLWRWLAIESRAVVADEPVRVDPHFVQWVLGERDALANDARVRRALRPSPWPGSDVLRREADHAAAANLLEKLREGGVARFILLGGDDLAGWRALLELATRNEGLEPIRVDSARLAGLDSLDVEDCAVRIGRMALLTGNPLVVDAAMDGAMEGTADRTDQFLAALERTNCRAVVICHEHASVVRHLDSAAVHCITTRPISTSGRVAAVQAAAYGAGASLTDDAANDLANRFPLSVDGLEHAMRLAAGTPTPDRGEARVQCFIDACRKASIEGLSNLAERIEPVFRLDEVVLPTDRKRQLQEVVDHVRFAAKVFDGWNFGGQLPYGRGVTALFYGPSGTGKTMAAMGIASALGVQLLRIDLSRVVSKYIGDTEKNIDRVFRDAQRSGSAILIDEADALLGKRSEVKDAHDRYANIEVAYLLQRMEAYEGLAVLTSNMRQNLDPAFLRRLRFIVDFPPPDAAAREQIWRFCLPTESHALDDAAFRHLARKIDLTGGHIRQITLRAAFIAAAAETTIGLEHIADAARAEFAKLGMPPAEIDVSVGRRAA